MSRIRKGEMPITKFMDEEDAINVSLISYPDPETAKKVIVDFVYGYKDGRIHEKLSKEEIDSAIEELKNEGTLPKAFEAIGNFVFLVENISLTITHCLVRHRFFSIIQKSTAVEDLRDESFVMPKSFGRDKDFYKRVKKWYLQGKDLYVEAVDKHGISVQNARLLLPKNNSNHMLISANLMAIKNAYAQRTCTAEEPIQNNIIFHKMRDLIVEKFPYLDGVFVSADDTGACLHCKTGKHSNIVFKRDERHMKCIPEGVEVHDDLLHDETRDYMNRGKHLNTEIYEGDDKVV